MVMRRIVPGEKMNLKSLLDEIKRRLFGNVGASVSDFEAYLTSKGCIIVPFVSFLSNPCQPVMLVTEMDAVKAYVDRWASVMVIKAVYRQGKTYYFFSSSEAIRITI